MIQPERIRTLNRRQALSREYVLYWMQSAQRAVCNHALEYAVRCANERQKPLLAAFGLTPAYPNANLRHYIFMLEGLQEAQTSLARRDIQLTIQLGEPAYVISNLAARADLVITDEGYLHIQRQWRHTVAEKIDCPLYEITSNLIVPVETASEKENYSAGTLRPRIHRQLERFLIPLHETRPHRSSLSLQVKSIQIDNPLKLARSLGIDSSVPPSPFFRGGYQQARRHLIQFLQTKLTDYDKARNNPVLDGQSNLSPYLHFGQISPLEIALAAREADEKAAVPFLEELIVRRELSHNFVYYNPNYDRFEALPHWAQRTLRYHSRDKRPALYTPEQMETASTADPYWNAAQMEMVLTGKMHGYMRMYWGKKVLEWTRRPEEALRILIALNDKYELDGRDPNGYAGIAWCLGKHDRPWKERPVFGQVRYMNAAGLRHKFKADLYVQKIRRLQEDLKQPAAFRQIT
ncbi:MAG TPA: deoxyribodipyrimidine photo-lyase [Anaerohalosphaeraceae bacterium]|nr:deoxyribodipyrimidine photo-lyase [Anaerohalosphaeraceae bacterium]